jgi:hypothetical protein
MQAHDLHRGMPVRDLDGHHVGKVMRADSDAFSVQRHIRELRFFYDQIQDLNDGQVRLEATVKELDHRAEGAVPFRRSGAAEL